MVGVVLAGEVLDAGTHGLGVGAQGRRVGCAPISVLVGRQQGVERHFRIDHHPSAGPEVDHHVGPQLAALVALLDMEGDALQQTGALDDAGELNLAPSAADAGVVQRRRHRRGLPGHLPLFLGHGVQVGFQPADAGRASGIGPLHRGLQLRQ